MDYSSSSFVLGETTTELEVVSSNFLYDLGQVALCPASPPFPSSWLRSGEWGGEMETKMLQCLGVEDYEASDIYGVKTERIPSSVHGWTKP